MVCTNDDLNYDKINFGTLCFYMQKRSNSGCLINYRGLLFGIHSKLNDQIKDAILLTVKVRSFFDLCSRSLRFCRPSTFSNTSSNTTSVKKYKMKTKCKIWNGENWKQLQWSLRFCSPSTFSNTSSETTSVRTYKMKTKCKIWNDENWKQFQWSLRFWSPSTFPNSSSKSAYVKTYKMKMKCKI